MTLARLACPLLAAAVLCLCAPLFAAERLDDSASPRSRVAAQIVLTNEGRSLEASTRPTSATIHFGRVEYRLATARYAGRQARIYYVVPALITGLRSPGGMRVTWRGDGVFASGTARPGERQIVWSGIVPGAWLSGTIELDSEVSLRELQLPRDGSFGFESYFEIEVAP